MPAAVTPPMSRAAVVAVSAGDLGGTLRRLGMAAEPFADPYTAAADLFRRPLAFRAVVLSLRGVYREELSLIGTLRRRLPHVEVWLAEVEGHAAALASAVAAGATGLLDAEGLHRLGPPPAEPPAGPPATAKASSPAPERSAEASDVPEADEADPLLSADELRALLHDDPPVPPPARPKPAAVRNGRG